MTIQDAAATARTGYDPAFLGTPLPLPTPAEGQVTRELPYTHFTVLLNAERRLAVSTGVNIDGESLVEVGRADDWHFDSRIPAGEQTGEEVYARNDIDRGHLVRRRDPVWGDAATARAANEDTFCFTNAAPQAGAFNQSKELWLGLEDHVLAYAQTNRNRISVFTAPVLDPRDPLYRGVRLPRHFWKIAAWSTTENDETVLRAAGFVLDQTPELDELDLEIGAGEGAIGDGVDVSGLRADTPPPLGPYRTYQVPIADIAQLTGLEHPLLTAADVLAPAPAHRPHALPHSDWIELRNRSHVRLGANRDGQSPSPAQ